MLGRVWKERLQLDVPVYRSSISMACSKEHNMVIVEKLKKLEDDQTGLVAVINEIFKILENDGLVYKLKVEPEKVGPHMTNRGGTGLCERHAHNLLRNITDVGYSDKATDPHAIEDDIGGEGSRVHV